MSLTAWVVKTFFRKPKNLEQTDSKVKTVEVLGTSRTVYKIAYFRNSEYTYQDTISINGVKLNKGCSEDNFKSVQTYISLKHNFDIEQSQLLRMRRMCSVGISEKINLSSNVVLDLKVTVQ